MKDLNERYVNPYTDFGFKKLFGTEVNKALLIDFLNELIKDYGRITDVKYLKTEQLGDASFDRKAIYDIYCESENGSKFIVEMQQVKQVFFKDRSIFYVTFPIREQAVIGDWNYELKPVYIIAVLDFVFDEGKDEHDSIMHKVMLCDRATNRIFYDKLTFIYLEMPKFNKKEEDLVSHFDKWLYVLRNLSRLKDRPAQLRERIFDRLFKTAEIAGLSKEEMTEYEESLKHYRDYNNTINYTKQEGIKEGIEVGREEGLREGETKGRNERDREIVQKCLQNGMTMETISELTGLTMEQIKDIQAVA